MNVDLHPADVFFTRGFRVFSRLIRFFTRGAGEARTKVNHVGIVVSGGTLESAEIIEAVDRVRRHRLWNQYGLRSATRSRSIGRSTSRQTR